MSDNFLIYTASAGSGKTFTLVKEYLKIILTHPTEDAYRKILAITFTNKAVEEMKSRILDTLLELSKEDSNKAANEMLQMISDDTGKEIQQLKAKAKTVFQHILHHYGSFEVATIDKFTHRIIRSFANELQLNNNFQVQLNFDPLLEQAIDLLLSEAGEEKELTELFLDFTLNKLEEDKSWNIKNDFLQTGKILQSENHIEELKKLDGISLQDFKKWQVVLKKSIPDQQNQLVVLVVNFLETLQQNMPLEDFSRKTFPNFLQKLIHGDVSDITRFETLDDVTINKSSKHEVIWEGLKTQLSQDYQKIKQLQRSIAFTAKILKDWTQVSVLATLDKVIYELQKEQNILPIKEFNKIINEQIQNQPAPFIYEKLGDRYQHFFIDEFQDTSELQWKNLVPLISNALDSEDANQIGGSVMLVGDPKQSIYRFRGGKVEQMIGLVKEDNPFKNHTKKVVNLPSNFRSFQQVVAFNNNFFSWMSDKFKLDKYSEIYKSASQIPQKVEKGLVEITFLEDEDNIQEAYLQKVRQHIEEALKQGYQYQDIAVLVRKNASGQLVAAYLIEQQIPIISSDSLMIGASQEVKILWNFVQYIQQPQNEEAKTALLEYFSSFVPTIPKHDFIFYGKNLVKLEEVEVYLNQHQITIHLQDLPTKSIYEQASYFAHNWLKLKETNAFVHYFLQMIFEWNVLQQKPYHEVKELYETEGYKKSIPSNENENAVKIMTFHKAKGLEFPVVIIPFLDYKIYEHIEKLWINTEQVIPEVPVMLVSASNDTEQLIGGLDENNPVFLSKEERLLDAINAMYVAFTRAREQMHIITQVKKTNNGVSEGYISSYLYHYLTKNSNDNYFVFGEKVYRKPNLQTSSKIENLAWTQITPWTHKINITTLESRLWASEKGEERRFGNVMHQLLSEIKNEDSIKIVLQKAIKKGWIVLSQKETFEQRIQEVVNHPELKDYYQTNTKTWNERTILTPNQSFIPDKVVFVSNQEVVLIDYKTGKTLAKHQQQLQEYESILNEMQLKVVKKILVYLGDQCNVITL